jgi:carboxypeptidase PM20D1
MSWFLTALGVALVLALLVIVVRTVLFRGRQESVASTEGIALRDGAAKRLAGSLRFETITKRDPDDLDRSAYEALYDYLRTSFPKVHDALDAEPINDLSRLYRWDGSDPSLAPIVLMAHVDVVPVEEETIDQWTHPPFGGAVADGYVWGRGALDDKASVVAIFEAVETLLAEDYRPTRTVYLAIGHDEEVGGENGARHLATRIGTNGTRPAMVVDEGGAITIGAIPDFERPLALVGIAEKGYLSIEISAEGLGGHSSVPPEQTSIGTVARAVNRLRDNPLPARLDGVTGQTFDHVAPEMGGMARVAFANLWLLQPLVEWALSRNSTTDAAIRTTTAPTMLEAGVKDNVVPSTARAVVNFRILPSQSVDDVLAHVDRTLDDLPVSYRIIQQGEPTTVSPTDSPWFKLFKRTVREVASEEVVVAPYLVPGTTDSRHYSRVCDHVFRFAPFTLTTDDRERIHGIDERISLGDYERMVHFYAQIVRNADALPDAADPAKDRRKSEA